MSTRRKQLQQYQIQKILQQKKIVLFYQCSNVRADKWESIKKSLLSAMTGNALEKAEEKLLPPLTLFPSLSGGSLNTLSMATPFSTLLVKNRIGQQSSALKRLGSSIPNSADTAERTRSAPGVDRLARKNHKDSASIEKCCYQPLRSPGVAIEPLDNRPTEINQWSKLFQGPTFLFGCNSHREMVLGCEIINTKSQRETSLTLLGGIYHGKIMNHLDLIQLAKLDLRVYTSLASCLEETTSYLLHDALSFHQSRLLLYLHYYAATLFDPLIHLDHKVGHQTTVVNRKDDDTIIS